MVFVLESISSIRVTCLTPCGVEKRTTTLICEANGTPLPEYSWSYGQVSHPHRNANLCLLFL